VPAPGRPIDRLEPRRNPAAEVLRCRRRRTGREVRVRIRNAALLALAALAPGGSFVPSFTLDSGHAEDGFGSALATGDVDGDGTPDIAVGAPAAGDGAGAVTIWSGRTHKLLRELHGAPGEHFGQSVALTYLAQDSMSDLIVGAPGWKDGAGAVYLAVRP